MAEREIKDTDITVAVNVRGTLDNPFIAITSTPSMSSNEALSYLLTGRSIDTLQSGEAPTSTRPRRASRSAAAACCSAASARRLGLDEVSVEQHGRDDTSVVLGKYLSPKLFVSYGISIAEAINTIKLRYTLNEKWSVQGRSGSRPERRHRVPDRAALTAGCGGCSPPPGRGVSPAAHHESGSLHG